MFQPLDEREPCMEFSALNKHKQLSVHKCYLLFCKLGVPKKELLNCLHLALHERSVDTCLLVHYPSPYTFSDLMFLDEPEFIGPNPQDNIYLTIESILKQLKKVNFTFVQHDNYD